MWGLPLVKGGTPDEGDMNKNTITATLLFLAQESVVLTSLPFLSSVLRRRSVAEPEPPRAKLNSWSRSRSRLELNCIGCMEPEPLGKALWPGAGAAWS